MWTTVNAMLVLLLIATASFMKVTTKTPKVADPAEETPAVVVEENG